MLKPMDNVDVTMGQINRSEQGFYNHIESGWAQLGAQLVDDATRYIIDPPKTGLIYIKRVNGRRVRHQASAPSESPANLTGNLAKSNRYEPHGWQEMEFGNDADYAGFLENMWRPFITRAINENEGDSISLITARVDKF